MKKLLLFFFFLHATILFSQDKSVLNDCIKKEFLIKNVQDENLIKAIEFFFLEEYEDAYLLVKELQEKPNEKVYPYSLLLEADILYKTASYTKALQVYSQLLKLNGINKDIRFYSYINVGNIHVTHFKEYKESVEYYNKAKLLLKDSPCQEKELLVYLGLGNSYLFSEKYLESENSYRKALAIYQENQDAENIARCYSNLANLFYEQYQDSKAEAYFLKALNAVKNTTHIKVKQQVYLNLYLVNHEAKKYKKALEYLSKSNSLKDSIWNRDKVWELAEKDKQIAVTIKEKELLVEKELTKEQRRRIQWFGAILIVILLFSGTLFYSYKTKVKQNIIITAQKGELEKLNHTKNYLFSVISHDLRSPVKMLIKQQQRFIKKIKEENLPSLQETAGSTLAIAEGLKHLLNNVLHWSLEQNKQLLFDKRVQALHPTVTQVLFDFKLLVEEKKVTIETFLDEEIFVDIDRESLKVILRNLLDNAIKYTAEGGVIKVSTIAMDDTCYIEVEDSGIGISEEQLERINSLQELSIEKINRSKGIGLGLLLCTTLTKKNNGIFQIDGELNKGTAIKISFPIVKDVI